MNKPFIIVFILLFVVLAPSNFAQSGNAVNEVEKVPLENFIKQPSGIHVITDLAF